MEKREYVNPKVGVVVLDKVCAFDEVSGEGGGGEGASLNLNFEESEVNSEE
ncbi:MAG: hypothetical protein IJV10_05665 [Prevotella sp.]|nr:hypothetical protein [Prevotella sp.]